METTIIANSYKLGLKENSESNMPMEKETGKREAREEGADGADGVDGVEEAESESGAPGSGAHRLHHWATTIQCFPVNGGSLGSLNPMAVHWRFIHEWRTFC